jgi:hypothetical protein
MNGKNLTHPRTYDREVVLFSGNWLIGAAGAVGAKTGGQGLELARTDEGDYTVSFPTVPSVLDVHVDIVRATPVDEYVQINAIDASAGEASFTNFDGGSTTPDDPAEGDTIMITVIVKNTSVPSA